MLAPLCVSTCLSLVGDLNMLSEREILVSVPCMPFLVSVPCVKLLRSTYFATDPTKPDPTLTWLRLQANLNIADRWMSCFQFCSASMFLTSLSLVYLPLWKDLQSRHTQTLGRNDTVWSESRFCQGLFLTAYHSICVWLCFAEWLSRSACFFLFLFYTDHFCSCRLDEELREASEAAK